MDVKIYYNECKNFLKECKNFLYECKNESIKIDTCLLNECKNAEIFPL